MDAAEAGDLLDRVSLADSLHGEMSSALQFFGRTRGSHATEDSDPKAGCSIIFLNASKGNTVQRSITTASEKVFFKGGRCRCSDRFFFHFDIFRLITRGLIRLRRGSVRSTCISHSTPRYHASKAACDLLSHSGSRHFRIWKHPVKDNASGSSPAVPAASNIRDRITKWPSDSA